jgi:ABC-2 type transport system permease protein
MLRDFQYCLLITSSDILFNLAGIVAALLLAERFNGIGIWSKAQILFMIGYGTVVRGIVEMFFNYNISHISRRIGRGQLDHSLIQPQPLWLAFLTEGFLPVSGSGVLLTGIVLLTWACSALALPLTSGWIGMLLLHALASVMMLLAVSFLLGSLAFYAPYGMEEISTPVFELFYQLMIFPLDGLNAVFTSVVLTALPIGLASWYPSRYLLGLSDTPLWGVLPAGSVTPLMALVLFSLSMLAFRKGLSYYGATGSQRYKDMGHRR